VTAARRPNIVLILTDDHGSQAISAYGSVVNTTPRIDGIGVLGARFANCFVTNSLCSPSRASILTGTYSHVNGVTTLQTPIDAAQPTFVSQLKAAGYRTAIVGKWHLGHGEGHDPQGFDYWDVFVGSHGQGEYWDPVLADAHGERVVEGYATDIVTDLATDWVDGLDGDDPWCVLIYHKAPHRSWEPHPRHVPSEPAPLPVPETFDDDYATRSASVRRVRMRVADDLTHDDLKADPPAGLAGDDLARWKYQRFMEDYLACVASVDENVGRVVDWLDARGDLDDTLLMYASDQGFFLGEHGWFDKRLMFEESLRMPLLVSYPRAIAAGRVVDDLVTNVDWAPTILEAAGVPPHPRMQGRSFWPELVGGEPSPPHPGVYYRYWENEDWLHHAPAHYGYRTERHKLIHYYNDPLGQLGAAESGMPPEWELYDLVADPHELRNVADDPAYAAIRAELESAMLAEQLRLGDTPAP
jgi:arylsulfatase A-like enzyme